MTPYFADPDLTLYSGDAASVLRELPDRSVHMACCSPPFFGLRDYGTGTWEGGNEGCAHVRPATGGNPEQGPNKGNNNAEAAPFREVCGLCGARRIDSQIGLESSPDEWAARLVDVFREVRRVLREDGTLWVEVADSYAANRSYQVSDSKHLAHDFAASGKVGVPTGCKPKDLILAPHLLAFALRADGWYLRSCIVWAKPNAMPESVSDRPTSAHSYLFLFGKSDKPQFWTHSVLGTATRPKPKPDFWWFPPPGVFEPPSHRPVEGWPRRNAWRGHDYFYDAEALREPASYWGGDRPDPKQVNGGFGVKSMGGRADPVDGQKNARSVWTISTEPNALAICRVCDAYWQGGAPREHCSEPVVQHFAAFPRELVRRMILAGTSERGVCPECGAPWVREVEKGPQPPEPSHRVPAGRLEPGQAGNVGEGNMGFRASRLSGQEMNRWRAEHPDTTLGWHPSCECGADPVSAMVLDPFSGSGTTLLVARQLGRHGIGIELNERYAAMTRARLAQLSLLAEA